MKNKFLIAISLFLIASVLDFAMFAVRYSVDIARVSGHVMLMAFHAYSCKLPMACHCSAVMLIKASRPAWPRGQDCGLGVEHLAAASRPRSCYRQDAVSGKLPVLNLLTGQKSAFSPRREWTQPRGTWVRLATRNFTPIGSRRWERDPQI